MRYGPAVPRRPPPPIVAINPQLAITTPQPQPLALAGPHRHVLAQLSDQEQLSTSPITSQVTTQPPPQPDTPLSPSLSRYHILDVLTLK